MSLSNTLYKINELRAQLYLNFDISSDRYWQIPEDHTDVFAWELTEGEVNWIDEEDEDSATNIEEGEWQYCEEVVDIHKDKDYTLIETTDMCGGSNNVLLFKNSTRHEED